MLDLRRHRRRLVTGTAVTATTALLALQGSPALAAEPVASADATAWDIAIAVSGTDSGTYTATHDGTEMTTSGTNTPVINLADGQQAVNLGLAAQDAVAGLQGDQGTSAACAGFAGEGATLVSVGDSWCLEGGQTLRLNAASLDLSALQLIGEQSMLGQQLKDAGVPVGQLNQVLQKLLGPLTQVIRQGLTALGDAGLVLDLGATQAKCSAGPDGVEGSANLGNLGARLTGLGQDVSLIDAPVDPAPNTKLVTDLGDVVEAILNSVRASFEKAAATSGPLAPVLTSVTEGLAPVLDQQDVLTALLNTIGEALAPLQENVLDITLNEQTKGDGWIEVTALHAEVLPAAKQFLQSSLVDLKVGRVKCGPNGAVAPRSAPPAEEAPPSKPKPEPRQPDEAPPVPTSVPAGAASLDDGSPAGTAAVGALLLVATGAGLVAYRRRLHP